MRMYGETSLAIPRLGSGIDLLSWEMVSQIVYGICNATDIDVTLYYRPQDRFVP